MENSLGRKSDYVLKTVETKPTCQITLKLIFLLSKALTTNIAPSFGQFPIPVCSYLVVIINSCSVPICDL